MQSDKSRAKGLFACSQQRHLISGKQSEYELALLDEHAATNADEKYGAQTTVKVWCVAQ
jgi:hypothetical protein